MLVAASKTQQVRLDKYVRTAPYRIKMFPILRPDIMKRFMFGQYVVIPLSSRLVWYGLWDRRDYELLLSLKVPLKTRAQQLFKEMPDV